MKQISIYTDGACSGNPGAGGWAAILTYNEHEKIFDGGDPFTTNNQMELTAAIKGLEAITAKEKCQVDLYTDSEYVVKGMTQWIKGWKAKGWRKAKNEEIKNKGLWQQLDQAASKHDVSWHWIKGHAGHQYNERCDALARKQIEKYKSVPHYQVGDRVSHEARTWLITAIENGQAFLKDDEQLMFPEEKQVPLYALSPLLKR